MKEHLKDILENQRTCKTGPEATVAHAAKLMAYRNIGALPVVEGDTVVGIFTERDLLTRVVAHGHDPETTTVGKVMTLEPRCAQVGETIAEAVRAMQEMHCRHLPVLEQGRLVGIVGLRDLVFLLLANKDREIRNLEEYFEYLPPEPGPGGD